MRHRLRFIGLLLVALTVMGRPAFAQLDVSGEWGSTFHEDLPHRGPMMLGDYTGLPYNEEGFRKAASWDEAARSTRERQCIPHVVTYSLRGPATIRFSKVVDVDSGRLQAYSLVGSYGRPRTIWMDGRQHPTDLAPHSWAGFSTGRWERNALVVTTTHIKAGWLQRNGSPTSDLATMKEHFVRHGDHLMVVTIIDDPVYLTEPFIRTTNYVYSPTANANAWGSCGPAQITDELPGRSKGEVPHYLPGDEAHIEKFLEDTGIADAGIRTGGPSIYPEFAEALRAGRAVPRAPSLPMPPRADGSRTTGEIETIKVQGNVSMLAGAGGNIAVQAGDDGVLVIDAGPGNMSGKVIDAIRRISDKPIRFIVNTHAHLDNVGGNEALAKAGAPIGGGLAIAGPTATTAAIYAHEGVLMAISAPTGQQSLLPSAAWPSEAYSGDTKEIFTNGEAIQLFHPPAAHTDGDSIAFFRKSDVLVTGDIFSTVSYPVIDVKAGGSFTGIVDALNRLIDIAIPKDWQEGGTMVIPGRGRVGDEADLVEYRDMVTIIRDRIQDMVSKGMTLAQVKAARPTFEYDRRYGATTGDWTTDMFVDAAYQDLSARK
jgi:glyoxylase-like metal-dependent hydrolase (beta-lactamase superfamily II)